LIPAFLSKLRTDPFLYSLGFTQFYVASACIVSAVVVRGVPRNLVTTLMGKIGMHSYSIYLWHLVVLRWGVKWTSDLYGERLPPLLEISIYAIGSVLIGVLMSKLVEYPVVRLRDRLFPSAVDSRSKERLVDYEIPQTTSTKPAVEVARSSPSPVESNTI